MVDPSSLLAEAAPASLVAAVRAHSATMPGPAGHAGHPEDPPSVRKATHRGHQVVVRTHYEIEVDGAPFQPHHVSVGNDGRVHYHGLPTRDFASMIDLVAKAIDAFPADFPGPPPPDPAGPTDPAAPPEGHGPVHPHVHPHGSAPHGADGREGGGLP